MLERLRDLPDEIEGVKAVGKVSKEDYEQVYEPVISQRRREGGRVRFLYQLGHEFEGFTASGAWEDAKIGVQSMQLFDGFVIVSDVAWIREAVRLISFLAPCPMRVYGNHEFDQAVDWLGSLPEGPAISHRLFSDIGVIVVEVKQRLRAQDFDELAASVDPWIEEHGELKGIVVHTHEFPGWENLGSLLRHLRFVRDHHRKIRRIALAADGKLASLAPAVGEHFVKAEVKHFSSQALESAIAWAGGELEQTPDMSASKSPSAETRV